MALGKALKLGGIENKLPKTEQSVGRFRVARNVQPTPDGRIIPRYDYTEIPGQVENRRYISFMAQYDNSMLSIASDDTDLDYTQNLYKDLEVIPQHSDGDGNSCLGPSYLDTIPNDLEDTSFSNTSFRINNTTYFCNPYNGTAFKYDGVEVSGMGCPQPEISSSQYASAGTTWVLAIYHRLDFDNNEPVSEYVKFPATPAGAVVNIREGGGVTNIIGSQNVTPAIRIDPSTYGSEALYYRASSVSYSALNQDYTITATDTNIVSPIQLGAYIFVSNTKIASATLGVSPFVYSGNVLGVALKVKSISPLKLDALNAKILTQDRLWITTTVTYASLVSTLGSRTIVTYWSSNSETGVYAFKGINYSFQSSSLATELTIINVAAPTTPFTSSGTLPVESSYIVNISPYLSGWYNPTYQKLSLNSSYDFNLGSIPGVSIRNFNGMTAYQNLLLYYTDNIIWYSDNALGASYEQTLASNFIIVGEQEFGRIVSVCATSDFIFVSRERKNYFVNGNIETGNYRVQEIPDIEIGVWSNNATILVKDSVIAITALGVFQVTGGGRVVKVSDALPKMFSRYDEYDIDEDVVFTLEGTTVMDVNVIEDYGISVAYDEFRNFLFIMRKGRNFESNPVLVMNTMTGEFYEWNGQVLDSGEFASCIAAMRSEIYVAKFVDESEALGAKIIKEDKTSALIYPSLYPIKLYSTWMTAGEPSLEKQLLQLKMFGRIYPADDTTSIHVIHFKDWDYSVKITDVVYLPISTSQYSHKQRLNSDKVLATSCGIEVTDPNVLFELESMEIEFNGIQQGMKR